METNVPACTPLTWKIMTLLVVGLSCAGALQKTHAQSIVTSLGASTGWYSDDTRNSTGTDLVGVDRTLHGKPGQAPTAADDIAIDQQLQFVGGPAGSTGGGAVKIIAPTGNPAKSTLSTVNLSGFAPASDLTGGSFSASYRWYMEPNPTIRTVAFRIGIQSAQWPASQASFTAIRSGEQTWDLILVNLMDSPVANAWNDVSVDKDNGTWRLYGQATNGNWVGIAGSAPPGGGGSPKTLADWANDATWGPILFGAGAKITNVQFGLGSFQQGCNAYVDYLQTTLLNSGNAINFSTAVQVYSDLAETTLVNGYSTIQAAINDATTLDGYVVRVVAGTYNEDVLVNKSLIVIGAGFATTTVSGPIGGDGATFRVSATGVIIDGFTITRDGNNTTDWNDGGLNSAGVAIQGLTVDAEIRNCYITGNRTGIDVNNSNNNKIHNNVIDFNRTGLIFRNQTDNTTMVENEITDNWTAGVLFLDASSGTNIPVQTALSSTFSQNNISGNWYGQVVERQSGGSLPVPGTTNLKKFKCNWYGTVTPVVSIANSAEPGYAAQIPVAYGGAAVPPGGQPDIAGPASANIVYQPFLTSGADNDGGEFGFQPAPNTCNGCETGSLVTNTSTGEGFCSIQAAINDADPGDVLAITTGTYDENVDATAIAVTLSPGASPGCVTITGDLTLNSGDALNMEANSAVACSGYDQFIVNGTVTLGGATLNLTLGYTPSGADAIMLINNDGVDAVTGMFAQGATITVSGINYIINYAGGSGNDVVLQRECGDVCVGDIIRAGNVSLSTQTQVNTFLSAGCKYTQISGNLTITGYNGSSDPITNLCNLSELVSVGGTVTIRDFNNAANPTNLNDLANLTTIGDGVGTDNLIIGGSAGDQNSSFNNITLAGLTTVGNGSVTINNNPNVTTISLPALTTVGSTLSHNLTVGTNGTAVTSINLSALTTVGGDVTMNNAVAHLAAAAVNLGSLTTVGDDMNLTRTAGSLNIGSLQTVDALTISTNSLPALNPTALTAVGAFAITSNTSLTSINSAPASFTATSLSVTGNTALTTATIGVSSTSGSVTISSNGTGVTALNLNNLGTVGGNLDMNNAAGHDVSGATPPGAAVSLNALTSVTGLFRMVRAANSVTAPNLTNVSGAFTFQRNGVTDLDAAFPELLTIGGNLNVTNNASLSQCCIIPCQVTVSGLGMPNITVSGNTGACANIAAYTASCKPTVFTVSGAPGCTGTVNLDGSQNGVEYELYEDILGTPTATGIILTGDGNPISFTGIEFGGDYTVVAALASGCTASMTGTVTVVPDFDLVVEAPTSASCGETITVTVKAGACGVKELGSIQFAMQWAATDFEYVSGSEMPAALLPTANVTVAPPPGNLPNTLRFGWIAPGSEVDIEAGDVLLTFQLKSKISTGSSTVDLIALGAGDLIAMQSNFYELTLPANTSDPVAFGSKPGYSVVIDGPANPVCPNTSISLSANVTGGAPGFAYTWNPNIGSSQAPAPYMHTGTTTYAVTVTDDDGCTTSATREVKDDELPTIECPTAKTRDTDAGECTYTTVGAEFDPTFDDNCTATIAYELSGETTGDGMTTLAGVVFNDGETTVTWTVTDNSGNAAVCSYVVTVEDNEDPTITTCPTNKTRTAPICAYETDGTEFDATFDDNCSAATIAYELTGATLGSGATTLAGVEFNRGVTTVVWTATDASNNSNSTVCSFTVTVGGDTPEITTTVQGTTLNNLNGPNTLTIQVCNENNTVTGTALTQLEMPMLPNVNVLIQITDSENINLASGAPAGDTERLDDLLPDGLDGPIGTTGATWQNYIDDVRLQTATQWGFVEITITPYTDLDVSGDFTAGDCLGTPIVVTIQVQPLPGATSAFVSPTAQDGAICSEELVEVNLGVNGFQLIGGGVPTPADYDYVVTQVRYSIDNGATYPVGNSGYPAGLTPGVDYVTNPLITGTQLMESLTNTTNAPIYLRYQVAAKLTSNPNCEGGAVTIRVVIKPVPKLQTTINTVQVTGNNNGTDDTGSFAVCNAATPNLSFTQFADVVAMAPAANVKVEQMFTRTNVTFAPVDDIYPLSAYSPAFTQNVALVNPNTVGTLEMKFRSFFDTNNDNVMDSDECVGDWVVYTVTVNPLPVMTCPADITTVCLDDDAFDLTTLTPTPNPAGGTFSGGAGVTGSMFTPSVAGLGTTNVTYSVTDGENCSNTCSFNITVNANPSSAFRTAGTDVFTPFEEKLDFDTDHKICAGSIVEYGAEADEITYAWSIVPTMGATILQGATDRNVQVQWTTAGTYTLTFLVTNSNGCTSTNSLEVTVHANPTAAISPDPAAVCAGIDLALNGNPTGGSGTYTTHAWTGAGALSLDDDEIQAPIFNNAAAGEYALTYTVTDDKGCKGSDDITVTVHANPTAAIMPDPAAVCAGFDLALDGNPTGGSETYTTHEWTDAGATSLDDDAIQEPTFNNAVAGPYALIYTVTDDNGCKGSDAITVTVNANPSNAFRPVGQPYTNPAPAGTITHDADHEICAGSTASYGALVTSGHTYVWSVTGGGSILTSTTLRNVRVQWAASGTLTLTVTHTATGCTSTNTIDVTVNPLPVMTCPDDITVCEDADPIDLATLAPAPAPEGGIFSGTGVDMDGIFTPPSGSGVYTITYAYTDGKSCTNTCTFTITVNALPVMTCPNNITICEDAEAFDLTTLEPTANPAGGTFAGTGVAMGMFTPPAGSGTYTITYTYTDGNSCTGTCEFDITVNKQPKLTAELNEEAVTANNDGVTDEGTFSVCDGGSVEITTNFSDAAGLTNVRVYQTVTLTNTSFGWCNNCQAPLGLFVTPTASPISLVNPSLPGSAVITFQAWQDDNDNSMIDPGECTGDVIEYTITVNALPVISFGFNGVEAGHNASFEYCYDDAVEVTLHTEYAGMAPYSVTYTVNGGSPITVTGLYEEDVIAASQLYTPGDYEIVVTNITDAKGCEASAGFLSVATATITIKSAPKLQTTINTVQVTANNNGTDDTGSFSVCNAATPNLSFTQFVDLDAMAPASNVKVEQVFTRTNVTFVPVDGIYPLSVYSPAFSQNVALVNPNTVGTLEMKFRSFFDTNNDNVMDSDECVGDWVVYTVTVNPLPAMTCPNSTAVCINALPFALAGGIPTGGTYAGTGVSAGQFSPAVAGAGPHTITYSYTDGNGCTNSCTFVITVNALPVMTCPNNITVCENDAAFTPTPNPAGGTFSGNGISGNMFSPGMAGSGTHTITYSFTDGNGCTNSCMFTITVNKAPKLTATLNTVQVIANNNGTPDVGAFSVCDGGSVEITTNFSDAAGLTNVRVFQTATLDNVSSAWCNNCQAPLSTFVVPTAATVSLNNPSQPGTAVITFQAWRDDNNDGVIDPGECIGDVIEYTITVNALPVVTCPADRTVCEDDAAFALTGASGMPAGGTGVYAGPGVTANQFNPAVAGDGVHTITYTYTDLNGCVNNTCTFDITVNPCVTISGKIIWKGNGVTGVNLVNVALTGGGGDLNTTGVDGKYSVRASMGGNFTVTPTKHVNMFNGVTGADATAIQQHLTGSPLITDFFRLLAADVNKSNSVSSVDAAIINQALLGNPAAVNIMNNTGSWRFVRTDYIYPIPAGPFTLPSFMLYDKRLVSTMMNLPGQDFYGVKTGDVVEQEYPGPGPGIANPELKPDPSVKPLVWRVRDRMLKTGETVELDFSVTNFTDIAAFQHGMRFDPSVLQYQNVAITGTGIPMDAAGNFGAYQVAAGELRTLWSVAQGVTLPGVQPMYRVRFTALQGGMKLSEVVSFDPAIMTAVAYTTALSPREVQLVFTDYKNTGIYATDNKVEIPNKDFDLLQNRPNPFSDRTTIGFILTEACDAQLRVFDISGRELWRSDKSYPAGYSEEVLRLEELNATGMLYYELTTPQGKQTRKMMAVKM